MPEIIQIFYMLVVYSLFYVAPLSIIKSNKNNFYFNLIINLNFLLFFSILPLPITKYSLYILLALFLILIKNNFLLKKDITEIKIDKIRIILIISSFFIISVQIISKLELGWDSKWFWYIKSLYYTQNKTFADLSTYVYNDFHPHLGSFLWSFFRNLSINGYEYTGRLFYIFYYIVGIHYISNNIFKNKIKNGILFICLLILTQKYIYFSGLQEILIFTTLIFISKFILIFLAERKFIYLFFITLSMNLLIWFKAEGIAYATIVLLIVNLISKLNIKFRVYFNSLFLLIIMLKISIYKYFKIKINDQPYSLEYILSLDFQTLTYKLYNITIYLSYNSLKNIILFIAGIIIVLSYRKILSDEYLRLILLFFISNIIFIFSAYIMRDMEIIYSLKTTIDRLVFTSSGFYLVFLVREIRKYTI